MLLKNLSKINNEINHLLSSSKGIPFSSSARELSDLNCILTEDFRFVTSTIDKLAPHWQNLSNQILDLISSAIYWLNLQNLLQWEKTHQSRTRIEVLHHPALHHLQIQLPPHLALHFKKIHHPTFLSRPILVNRQLLRSWRLIWMLRILPLLQFTLHL